MDIGAVLPVFLEGIRPVALTDAARDGRVLEARVTAMLTSTLARLSIGGQAIDVATPQPLPIGAMLTLKAEREGGELRLITQGPIRAPAAAGQPGAPASEPLPDILTQPVKTVLAKMQALVLNAMLGDASTTGTPSLATDLPELAAVIGSDARTQPTSDAARTGLGKPVIRSDLLQPLLEAFRDNTAETDPLRAAALPRIESGATLAQMLLAAQNVAGDTAPAAEADNARAAAQPQPQPDKAGPHAATASQAREELRDIAGASDTLRGAAATRPGAAPVHAGADLTGAPARTAQPMHFTIELPFAFPASPAPLRLEVTRDDGEDAAEETAAPRPPSWTVRFVADTGRLGVIHAAITLAGDRVGVRLWAEQTGTATLFNQNAPRLQEALIASDVRLETLTIAEGRPAEPGRAQADSPASGTERRI
jgi:hypothetical protein